MLKVHSRSLQEKFSNPAKTYPSICSHSIGGNRFALSGSRQNGQSVPIFWIFRVAGIVQNDAFGNCPSGFYERLDVGVSIRASSNILIAIGCIQAKCQNKVFRLFCLIFDQLDKISRGNSTFLQGLVAIKTNDERCFFPYWARQ